MERDIYCGINPNKITFAQFTCIYGVDVVSILLLMQCLLHTRLTKLCLTARATVTSARIPKEDTYYRMCNMHVFSSVQKNNPGD